MINFVYGFKYDKINNTNKQKSDIYKEFQRLRT